MPLSHRSRPVCRVALLCAACALWACDAGSTELDLSEEADAYLAAALDTMQAYSLHKYEVDCPAFCADVRAQAEGSETASDTTSICGVVDLRSNSGGNMWPMIAGIGPVVGEGHLGAFSAPTPTRRGGGTRMAPPSIEARPP
jgi:hypothetical protein